MNTNTAAEYRDLPLAVLTESALKELVESIHSNRQPSHRPKLPRRPLHNQPSKKSTRRSLDPHRLRNFVPACPSAHPRSMLLPEGRSVISGPPDGQR